MRIFTLSRGTVLGILLAALLRLPAQSLPGHYQGMPFPEFAQELEARLSMPVFYAPEWVAGLTVQQAPGQTQLDSILAQTLAPRQLGWWRSPAGALYLLPPGTPLQTQLPPPAKRTPTPPRDLAEPEAEIALLDHRYDPGQRGPERRPELTVGQDRGQARATLSGYVRDQASGAPIPGASVQVEALRIGVYTDETGYFALTLPTGAHELRFRSFGMGEVIQPVQFRGEGSLTIELSEAIKELDEVLIEAERQRNVDDVQMGVSQLNIRTMRQMPALMGEVDVIKSALLLPGVQTVGEGSGGFNVRGGAVDQNLVLIQDAPVFNPNHLFGFFSAFNPDVISEFELYKSGIPARFGGRISSVFDIRMKEGNRRKYEVRGGISPVTGRLSVEGPLVRDKGSFVVGGRSTYSDWILRRLPDPALRNSRAGFFDLNGHVNYELNANNRLEASGYFSQDRFTLNADTTFGYQNRTSSLSWKHLFNPRFYGVFSGINSHYAYAVGSSSQPENAYELRYGIDYYEVKADFTWLPDPAHTVRFGTGNIWYRLEPGAFEGVGAASLVQPFRLPEERATESALYLSDDWTVNERLTVSAGLRFSAYTAYGPRPVFTYGINAPRELSTLVDTVQVPAGQVLQRYQGPEYRLALRYRLDEVSSLKFSFNRMRQYLHRISNTVSIAPTDIWKLSDRYIRPQVGDQYSIGYFRNFRQNSIETSVELYYKPIRDILDYKAGASLLLNDHLETEVINGEGRAYGAEFLIRKNTGRLNGWVSYTYSRTLVRVDGDFPEEKVNNGAWFPANQDKPHDLTLVGNYRFSRRLSVSSNFTYSTGRPITFPVAQYRYGNSVRVYYSDRNAYRVPDYMRWDLSVNVEGNHKIKKLAHSSVSFSVYNVLGRRNVFNIYFVSQNGQVRGYQLSIFGRPFATVTYNFRM